MIKQRGHRAALGKWEDEVYVQALLTVPGLLREVGPKGKLKGGPLGVCPGAIGDVFSSRYHATPRLGAKHVVSRD